MIIRGSLKLCINSAQVTFQQTQHEMLSIINVPKGKYYFLVDEEGLLDYNMRDKSNEMRLVFRGTHRELSQFAKIVNLDLFKDTENAERTSNTKDR